MERGNDENDSLSRSRDLRREEDDFRERKVEETRMFTASLV